MNTEIQQQMFEISGEKHLVLMKEYRYISNTKVIRLNESLNDIDFK